VRKVMAALGAVVTLTACQPGLVSDISPAGSVPGPSGDGFTVVRVIDGDTIEVSAGERTERVRLIGINATESEECFSAEASAALAGLVEGREVLLVPDRSNRDQYGRLLRYVYADGIFVNQTLVAEGFALAVRYRPDTARATELESAQEAAKAALRGLWAPDACGHPVLPSGMVTVSGLVCDAPGNDAENLNGEWAEIRNAGTSGVDLTGWVLKDESSSHRYLFPQQFVLPPNATVRIHSGSGIDAAADLYWGNATSAVWDNDGDTAFLLDPNGNAVSTRSCRE
jgi:micrococcal nuclease